jgi:hypothetical protein
MPRRNDIQKILVIGSGQLALDRWGVLVFLLCATIPQASGQVDCFGYRKHLVSKVEGRVFDPSGIPIPKAEITLRRDSAVVSRSETDDRGRFVIKAPTGKFDLRAEARGFAEGYAILDVGHDPIHLLHRSTLWIILGVGTPGPCPTSTTNHREFLLLIEDQKKQLGLLGNNATQK